MFDGCTELFYAQSFIYRYCTGVNYFFDCYVWNGIDCIFLLRKNKIIKYDIILEDKPHFPLIKKNEVLSFFRL